MSPATADTEPDELYPGYALPPGTYAAPELRRTRFSWLLGRWGIAIAVVASTLSAVIALLLVRALGWQLNRLVSHPAVASVDARLRARGGPAILSLRMIPAVPFSVLNYAAGASAVRLLPYLLATLAGLLPGTAAVVVLGDALTGNVSPLLALISLCTTALGVGGLVYELRHHRRHHGPVPAGNHPWRDGCRNSIPAPECPARARRAP